MNTIKKILKFILVLFIFILFLVLALGASGFFLFHKQYFYLSQAYSNFNQGVSFLRQENFSQAADFFSQSQENFSLAYEDLKRLAFLEKIFFLRNEYQFLNQINVFGSILARTSQNVSQFGQEIQEIFETKAPETNLEDFWNQRRALLLTKVYQSYPMIYGAKREVDLAIHVLDNFPPQSLLYKLSRQQIKVIRENLQNISQIMDDALPLLRIVPYLAGYPKEKKFLLLLQNNTELRPSGGFIGVYGILEIKAGKIVKLYTDDSYNLDRLVAPEKRPIPPEPLQKFLGVKKWYFRDSNWSPDFQESAKLALKFYEEEGGERGVENVIGFTPDVIVSVLKILGEIEIDSLKFTPENFVDLLEYEVEIGYLEKGVSKIERKEIINRLAYVLIDKIHQLKPDQIFNLLHLLRQELDEKHILIYSRDPNFQELIESFSWAGRIKPASKDYLSVIDANLAALKTDSVMKKKIFYKLQSDGSGLKAQVKILYENQGEFSWKTTRYRTYTRIYVPLGSRLVSVQGAMLKDKDPTPGPVFTGEELDKTVFGAFLSVEPKEKKWLEFTYYLPQNIVQEIFDSGYELLIQKQAGVEDQDLTIEINLDKKIREWFPTGLSSKFEDKSLVWETLLRKDQIFKVQF